MPLLVVTAGGGGGADSALSPVAVGVAVVGIVVASAPLPESVVVVAGVVATSADGCVEAVTSLSGVALVPVPGI